MAMEPKYDIFRDPIHGFIKVYDVEKDIINSPPFQRLRRIRQLGLTNLVYHGAEHTRFGHSIGVMDLASKILDSLWAKYTALLTEKLGWDEKRFEVAQNKLRLAALLHDIGHAPFSHAAESLFPEIAGKRENHETYGIKIVDQTDIGQIIDSHSKDTGVSVSKTDVLELMNKKTLGLENILLRNIFAGDLDADRMDYLLRDSLYTGVQYGKFDSDRLIEKIGLTTKKQDGSLVIAIEESGLHAAEGLLLARYFMFTQVYFHQIRRIYDIHLRKVVQEALKERFTCTEYPDDVKKYLELDDNVIFSFIQQKARDKSLEEAIFIQDRKHYYLLKQTSERVEGPEFTDFNKLVEALITKYGEEFVIQDVSTDAPYRYDSKRGDDELLVILKNEEPRAISARSKLIDHLDEIFQLRVYVHPDRYEDATLMLGAGNK